VSTAVPPIASAQARERLADVDKRLIELRDPTRDHLAECRGSCILKMRSPYHYEITIIPRLRVEYIAEKANRGH
jgi:hypothetical protein